MKQVISNVKDYKVVANNVVEMFGNVNDVVDYVVMMFKKHPNNAVYVNGLGLRLEMGNDGKWGCFLRDDDWNMIAGYVMGKIKRGLADAVLYCISRIEINNDMEENDMVNNVEMFNDYVKAFLVEDFENVVEIAEFFANEYEDTENEHVCASFDYDYDIRKMWADWCWENDVMSRDDAYKYYDANRDMFISEDDLNEIVEGFEDAYGVGIDDNCCGSCLIWVFNPYYVSEEEVKNDSPCLDRVVDTIKDYVDNYEGLLMNYDGNSASICVPWDVFNEDDMKMLIEDDGFEGCVVGALIGRDIKDVLVYDDGVYVSVDADMFDKVA